MTSAGMQQEGRLGLLPGRGRIHLKMVHLLVSGLQDHLVWP
jgi:hypothetical protein